jgi:hypothetical protein
MNFCDEDHGNKKGILIVDSNELQK